MVILSKPIKHSIFSNVSDMYVAYHENGTDTPKLLTRLEPWPRKISFNFSSLTFLAATV